MTLSRRLLRLLSALSILLVLPAASRAQQPGGDGPPAMAPFGGRMVRGTVTAVTADHLTVKAETGETYQVALTPNTQLRHGRDLMKAADIKVGDGVGALGEMDEANHTVHALFVQVLDAEEVKRAREALGKSYIAGKITAIDELKLTILRPDNVSQVIQVDEDTSFRRGGGRIGTGMRMGVQPSDRPTGQAQGNERSSGNRPAPPPGEAITLADLKVGDQIVATGALKGSVFVPAQLNVVDPVRRRRGGEAGAQPGSAPACPPQ